MYFVGAYPGRVRPFSGEIFPEKTSTITKEVTKMDMKNLSNTQKLTVSGAVMALYIVVMYFTQSCAFGQ